ncbi:hypothetical protein CFIO01_12048 [Colletotrichum fioriniae PJ7]|uniref:DUF7908 domain-containing protein n=1 Tax=Colletotrichum fioriniae PJ7 TaxID=1445577 RepID=A0A010SJT7_9PEZI|nr:hypothetical protein CFIO01_12048 [Colletotrichum fioriniae PJ7]
MKPRFILNLVFLSPTISASVSSFDHENDLPATWCFTYLSTYLEPLTMAAGSTGLETTPNSTSIDTAPLSTETNIGLSENPTFGVPGTPSFSLDTSLSATGRIDAPATTPLTISTSSLRLSPLSTATSDTSSTLLTTSPSASLTSDRLVPTTATSSGPFTSTSAQVAETVIFLVAPGPPTTLKRNVKKRVMGGFVNHNTNADRQLCNTATVFSLVAGELLDSGVPVYYSPGDSHKPLNAMGTRPNNAVTTTFDVFDGVLRFYHPSLPGSQASFCQDAIGQVHVTFTSRPPDCDPVSLLAYGGINIFDEHFRRLFEHLVVAHNQPVLQLNHNNSKLVNYVQLKFLAQQLKHICCALMYTWRRVRRLRLSSNFCALSGAPAGVL